MHHDHILKKVNFILGGGGAFLAQGHNLSILGKGSTDDATYQRPCGFRREDCFMFSYLY